MPLIQRHSQSLPLISPSIIWGLRMCVLCKVSQPPSFIFLSFVISMYIDESQAGTVRKP